MRAYYDSRATLPLTSEQIAWYESRKGKPNVRRRGRCSVCKRVGILSRDHDHKTGRQRGVICHKCNLALGLVGDNPELLRLLADYLEAI